MTNQWNPPTVVSNSNAASLNWQDYVSVVQDVMPWMQTSQSDFTQSQLDGLQLLTSMACSWAQRKLAQPIAPTTFNRKFDGWSGWNGAYVMLPYYPVLEIKSVIEYWGTSGPHYLSEQTFSNQIDGFQCDYQHGQLTRVFPGLVQKPWFPGSRNIQVEWTAGWNPLPADWKVATLEFIAHWYRHTFQQQANQLSGLGADPELVAQGLWAGEPLQIAGLLDTAVHVGMG